MKRTGAFLVLALAMASLSACAPAYVPITGLHAEGEVLYINNCAACHGIGGVGTASGPSMLDPAMVALEDAAYVASVDIGVEAGKWPGFEGMVPVTTISHSELAKVTAYIRYLQGFEASAAP